MYLPNGKSFEFHCHSHYSRGTKIPCESLSSPRDVVRTAKKKGLAGITLTDHNNIKSWKEASEEARKQGIIFIPGEEIETKSGHILGLGLSELIEPGLTVDETVENVREQGAVSVAAHPFDIRKLGVEHEMGKADAVEAFNSMNMDRFSNMFTEGLARKLGRPMIACTDAHTLEMIGTSTTEMYAHDIDSCLKAIIKGRVVMNKNYVPMKLFVDWSRDRMTVSYEDIMKYIKNNYRQPKAWLSEALLHKFLFSKHRFGYDMLARFGASCSVVYGSIKILKHL
jgi:predicted metal-dependent phosphoesterase TrpH